MNTYIIAYDVDTTTGHPKTAQQTYSDIKGVIEAFQTKGQLTESCWLVLSEQTHVEIRDALKSVARPSDRILVVKSAKVAAWQNLIKDNNWVRSNI